MRKILWIVLLSCILCALVGCNIEQKDIPVYGVYNLKKDILITVGMPKTEVDARLGDYEILYTTEYTYFLKNPKHKIIILYDHYPESTVRCIFIDTNNWRVNDESCYIGAHADELSESFRSVSPSNEIIRAYYDENGQVLDSSNYAQYYVSARAAIEDNCIYRISVVKLQFVNFKN